MERHLHRRDLHVLLPVGVPAGQSAGVAQGHFPGLRPPAGPFHSSGSAASSSSLPLLEAVSRDQICSASWLDQQQGKQESRVTCQLQGCMLGLGVGGFRCQERRGAHLQGFPDAVGVLVQDIIVVEVVCGPRSPAASPRTAPESQSTRFGSRLSAAIQRQYALQTTIQKIVCNCK